jgi:DHA1 family bicyclomycin/chloramphenicol resistance-like MFS transporter
LALDAHGAIAGTASALMGTLQFMTGAAVMAAVGLFVNGTARPMLAGIAAAALIALLITLKTLGRGVAAAAPTKGH